MPLFTLICTDKADRLALRMENREAHLAYLRETGVVKEAGPFLNDEGAMCGSLIVIEADSREGAEAWAASDPYAKAGLFAKVRIERWNRVI
jgi:hypothetical protein